MSTDESSREKFFQRIVDSIDGYLIPTAFGLLSFLVLIQVVTKVPIIRSHVDALAGRFVSIPTDVVPNSVKTERANVQLYISPVASRPDVTVFVNEQAVATFSKPEVDVSVREGDVIGIQSSTPGEVMIQVDQNDEKLLTPAPGQVVDVNTPNLTYRLTAARFIP